MMDATTIREGKTMQSEEEKRRVNRDAVKAYRESRDYFSIRPTKELGAEIRRVAKKVAEKNGAKTVSVQKYIIEAIEQRIYRDTADERAYKPIKPPEELEKDEEAERHEDAMGLLHATRIYGGGGGWGK